ncbi:MAG: glycoside hydrolase family 16 protein [Ignavibacteriales bacterium]|nr:glycoside hydrolase family 16 protein [Ignavibacteriales bacterium]
MNKTRKFIGLFYIILLTIFSTILTFCSEDKNNPVNNNVDDSLNIDGYKLVWNDEFDNSAIDLNKWEHEVNANGGGNNELQYYTARPENSFVKEGNLHLVALQEEYTDDGETRYYTSARMRTATKGDWTYVRVDVKAKLPYGQGLWPAIWMLPTDWQYGGWPASGEIDIMEHVGYDPGRIHGSIHTEAYNHRIGTQKSGTKVIPDANTEFHIYSIEWTEEKIIFLIDGEIYFTFGNDKQGKYETWPFDKRFHLLLNVAVGGDWPGNPTTQTIFPKEMVVDYVRVYEKIN